MNKSTTYKLATSIIIYGPPGCGKSRNKDKLALLFNRPNIVDNWDWRSDPVLPDDTIAFTNTPDIISNCVIHYDDAMKMFQEWSSLVRTPREEDF